MSTSDCPDCKLEELLNTLGEEVEDAEQEAFIAFTTAGSSRDLGMLDTKATSLNVSVGGKDYSLAQSPGLLHSSRDKGTTGAVVWQAALSLADWLSQGQNPLFARGILDGSSHVVELGCGINPVLALTLQGRVARYSATDQGYVLRRFKQNLDENLHEGVRNARGREGRRGGSARDGMTTTRIEVCELDWEADDVVRRRPWHEDDPSDGSVDAVIACDCVYNESMVGPFVQMCKAVCDLRRNTSRKTVCIVAQQLRAPDVYELWLREMLARGFRVWKVSDDAESAILSDKRGLTLHLAALQQTTDEERRF